MPESLLLLFSRYGYAVLVAGIFLECAGLPVPGETVLLAAAFLAHRGVFSLPGVIGLAIVAAILGDNAGYLVGRKGGRRLVERYGRLVRLTPARIAQLEGFFQKHGPQTVFFGRFVTGVRVFAALFAGMLRLDWRKFVVYNAAGAVVWATAVAMVGYIFGASWQGLEHVIGRAGLVLAVFVACSIVASIMFRQRRRIFARIEAHLPAAWTLREFGIILLNLAALGLFAKLAEDIVGRESTAFDEGVTSVVRRLDSAPMDVVMRAVSATGSAPAVIAVVALVLVWALRRKKPRIAAMLVTVAVATELLNYALKSAFRRPRPNLFAEIAQVHSYSFPSGHSMAAVAIYGAAAVAVSLLAPRLSRPLAFMVPMLAVFIGLSRIYLGMHWTTDVLAGFAAGLLVLLGGVWGFGFHQAAPPVDLAAATEDNAVGGSAAPQR